MTEHVRLPVRTDQDENPAISSEEARIIRERLATFDDDRKTARPADEVIERLLRRHQTP